MAPRKAGALDDDRATPAGPPRQPTPDAAALAGIAERVRACMRCRLCETRTHAVPGEGSGRSRILLVGEAPGRNEDRTGRPFCGAAGRILDLALAEARIDRADAFVTSIVKCRPPGNRDPSPDEKAACQPYLLEQAAALRPRVLVALGRHGLSGLQGGGVAIDFMALAGTFQQSTLDIPVFVSLHPAAVIYRQKWKPTFLEHWRTFGDWLRGEGPPGFGPGVSPPSRQGS
ncbi:MAG TPA: uracil-DNA glycosylase [Candidatus Thermoplasmatota archaeon]|nr:uracil-DNA glycosylase [Candidatus Thermoplasmatota archaeon]